MKPLITIFILFFTLSACGQNTTSVQNLAPTEFIAKINETTNKQLLDVRTPNEWNQGKVTSSSCIDYTSSDFAAKIQSLDKNKPVFVFCAAGGRSAKASKILEQQGFKQVYNLTGGGYSDLAKAGIK